jgi:hypothetical protein
MITSGHLFGVGGLAGARRGGAMVRIACAALLALVAGQGVAMARAVDGAVKIEGIEPPDTPRQNAALLYFQAWQSVPQATFERVVEQREKAGVLEKHQALVEGLLRAAETEHCDWGIQYEQGLRAMVPHLGMMRKTARIVAADAERLLGAEVVDAGAVARRCAALVKMSNQVRGDRILIAPLVGIAMNKLAGIVIDPALDAGTMPLEAAQASLNAYRGLDAEDPFGVLAGVAGEREIFLGWIRTHYKGAQAGRAFAEEMKGFVDPAGVGPGVMERLGAMDEVEFHAELDKVTPYYEHAIKAWGEPDAPERLEALGEKVAKGEFGLAGPLMAPSFVTVHKSDKAGREEVARMTKRLAQYIADGGKAMKAPEATPGAGASGN